MKCNRCNHEWVKRISHKPMFCPSCKSPYWNKQRKNRIHVKGTCKLLCISPADIGTTLKCGDLFIIALHYNSAKEFHDNFKALQRAGYNPEHNIHGLEALHLNAEQCQTMRLSALCNIPLF
jgi:hypothetical protein